MTSTTSDCSSTVIYNVYDPFEKILSGVFLKTAIKNNESIRMSDIRLSKSYYQKLNVDITSTESTQKIKRDYTTSYNINQSLEKSHHDEDLSTVNFPPKKIASCTTIVNSHIRGGFGSLDDTYLDD